MIKYLPRLVFLNRNHHHQRISQTIILNRFHSNNTTKSMEPRYDFNRQWLTTPTDIHVEDCDIRRRRRSVAMTENEEKQTRFKVISYNILAQDLLVEHIQLYYHHRPEWLPWRRRQQNLLREITKLDPDILCLQEMQYDHLPQLVQGLKGANGKRLEYIYKKKTGHRTDGCAIIYDACKFELLAERYIEFYTKDVQLLNRENVALAAKFKLKQSGPDNKEVCVATTHLLYNPKRDDVRCAQVKKLMNELQTFVSNPESKELQMPIILTGDFNSTINSLPIALLTHNNTNTRDNKSLLNFEALDPGEYTASTFQDNWTTVDFILKSISAQKNSLQVQSVYALPTITSCSKAGLIPNHYLGSDHYALGAVFSLV